MSYMLKRIKYTIFQLEIVISITLKQVWIVGAHIWNVITININVNISFM